MLRCLFTVASALSLLLCVATAALWVRSYARPVWKIPSAAPTTPSYRELGVGDGYFAISTTHILAPTPAVGAGYPYGGKVGGWNAMGLRWRDEQLDLRRPDGRTVIVVLNRSTTFSVWLGVPLLLSAILPAWWLIWSWKVNRENRKGTCRVCGYDLRASKERCPECGTPITSTPV